MLINNEIYKTIFPFDELKNYTSMKINRHINVVNKEKAKIYFIVTMFLKIKFIISVQFHLITVNSRLYESRLYITFD